MKNLILIIFFLFILSPVTVHGQTVRPQASSSPVLRNRLQLLSVTENTERLFFRFHLRLGALINRLENINDRMETRLTKLDAGSAVINRFTNRLDAQAKKIETLKDGYLTLEDGWKAIADNKEPGDYAIFKNKLSSMIKSSDSVAGEHNALIVELKKYKAKILSTPEAATRSSLTE